MTPPRDAHIFAALPTYEDFKKYRSAFAWLHRHGYKHGQGGDDAALQTRLQERKQVRRSASTYSVIRHSAMRAERSLSREITGIQWAPIIDPTNHRNPVASYEGSYDRGHTSQQVS